MIHRIFGDKPICVRPTQQILKPPKHHKTRDDLDDQVDFDNEFEMTNGNLELLSSTRTTGEKATVTVNFPSVSQSLPNSCSENNRDFKIWYGKALVRRQIVKITSGDVMTRVPVQLSRRSLAFYYGKVPGFTYSSLREYTSHFNAFFTV